MTALTHGLKYDVFISYRHNDNKSRDGVSEGWVTEFAAHLTTELETMVKGSVSIYFDKNPHGGLRETDQIDKSLAEKLHSLVFIPILSQTYCDPTSHVWTQEFLPFLTLSASDILGPTIKLQNGNMVSRVLPVVIHDLDSSDLNLLETHLQGNLRAIPFVFKSAGVNRPMRANEEDPLKNVNRTSYRDQINKVALAIKEIIQVVRAAGGSMIEKKESARKNTLLEGILKSPATIRSIAVLPLVFKSQDPEEEYLSQGFAEDLFGSLKLIKALRLSIHGLTKLGNGARRDDAASASVQATMILSGTMTIQDDAVGVTVRLVQSKDESLFWEDEFRCARGELFFLRPRIVEGLCSSLGITLKEAERKTIQARTQTAPAALEMYWEGRYHWRRRGNDLITSLECFEKAADLDPNFAPAFAGIANAAVLLGFYEMIPFEEAIHKCRDAAMNALNIDPTIIEAYYTLAFVTLCYEWAWPDAEHNFAKVFEINPGSPSALQKYKLSLTQIICTFEEAETESPGSVPYFLQAYALLHKGKFEEGLKVAQIAARKDPNSFMAQRAMGLCHLGMGQKQEAIDALNVAAQMSNRHPVVLFDLIGAYATMVTTTGAQEIVDEAMDRTNALPARINDFFFQPA